MNKLYLFKHERCEHIDIGIGSSDSKRRVQLTENEALQLAYRLMSLARGGTTFGMEEFKPKKDP